MSDALRLADEWEHRSFEIATELRRLDALVKAQAQIIEERDREIEDLREANEAFAQREHWWNDRMFDLEQELERLRAERVPLTGEQLGKIYGNLSCRVEHLGASTRTEIARAIEAAHGIHPLQRLADLNKQIGEKL